MTEPALKFPTSLGTSDADHIRLLRLGRGAGPDGPGWLR